MKQASSRCPLWYGNVVLSPYSGGAGAMGANADERVRYSAHDRTYETASISEKKSGQRNLEVGGLMDTLPRTTKTEK